MLFPAWKFKEEVLNKIKSMPDSTIQSYIPNRDNNGFKNQDNQYSAVSIINNELIGFYDLTIDYKNNNIENFGTYIFKYCYGADQDFMDLIDRLFMINNFNKIKMWTIATENKILEKLTGLINLRKVGIFKRELKDIYNNYIDIIYYEVTKLDYTQSRIHKRKNKSRLTP